MIHAGFVIENPITQSRTVVVESDAETKGMGWLLEVTAPAGAGPDIPEHLHLTWTETFEILEGTAHYKLNGTQKTAVAGDRFCVRPGELHIHPWNAGNGKLVYRQRNDFGEPTPAAVQDVIGVFATVADLARAGKVDRRGLPKNPLQMAVTVRTLGKHGGYDASLPIAVQKAVGSTLGVLAEWLGYRGVDPRYLQAE